MPKLPFLVTDSDSYKSLTLDYPTDNIFLMSPGVYTLREHELLLMGGSNDKGLIQLARGFKELSKFLGKAAGTTVDCGTKDELSAVEFLMRVTEERKNYKVPLYVFYQPGAHQFVVVLLKGLENSTDLPGGVDGVPGYIEHAYFYPADGRTKIHPMKWSDLTYTTAISKKVSGNVSIVFNLASG